MPLRGRREGQRRGGWERESERDREKEREKEREGEVGAGETHRGEMSWIMKSDFRYSPSTIYLIIHNLCFHDNRHGWKEIEWGHWMNHKLVPTTKTTKLDHSCLCEIQEEGWEGNLEQGSFWPVRLGCSVRPGDLATDIYSCVTVSSLKYSYCT